MTKAQQRKQDIKQSVEALAYDIWDVIDADKPAQDVAKAALTLVAQKLKARIKVEGF